MPTWKLNLQDLDILHNILLRNTAYGVHIFRAYYAEFQKQWSYIMGFWLIGQNLWLLMQQWSPLGPFKQTILRTEAKSKIQILPYSAWKQLCRTRPEWVFDDYLRYPLVRIANTQPWNKTQKKKGPTRDPELKKDCQGGLNPRTECINQKRVWTILYPL